MIEKTSQHIRNFAKFLRNSHPALIIFLEIIVGILITVLSIVLFIKIRNEVWETDFQTFDTQIINYFYQFRGPILNQIMIFISFVGGQLMVALAIIFTSVLLIKKHKREAFLFAFILVMAAIIDNVLKDIYQRPRPYFYPLVVESDYSFPSGHAMDSFVFYATLSYLFFHFTKNKALSVMASIFSVFMIGLVGLSRVYLGVHYPSDVLAGYVGGLAWFVCVLLIQQTLVFYKLFRER